MSKLRLAAPCLALAIAALGAPTASVAQISPAPNTFTLEGPLTFTSAGGPPIVCNTQMVIDLYPGGMTGVVSRVYFLPGNLACVGLHPTALPWPVARIIPSSLPRFSISNIKIDNIMNSYCDNGMIYVVWVNAPHNMGHAITQGVMPGNWNGNPYPTGSCKLDGDLYLTSGGPINVM